MRPLATLAALCTLVVLDFWHCGAFTRARSCRARAVVFAGTGDQAAEPERRARRTELGDERTDVVAADAPELVLQHYVRDLLDEDRTVQDLASVVQVHCPDAKLRARVDVLELRAPRETQLRVERVLEQLRRERDAPASCVLRIHPVADLVHGLVEIVPAQITSGSFIEVIEVKREDVRPEELFTTTELSEAIHSNIPALYSLHVQGKNLIVFAEPWVQYRVAEYLDNLRGP